MRTLLFALFLLGCGHPHGTEPPPEGWATVAPTRVEQALDRDGLQWLEVRQGDLRTWVEVPDVGAAPGDHVLLGRGTVRRDVPLPGSDRVLPELVTLDHVQVVDRATAEAVARQVRPADALPIGELYATLDRRVGTEVVVTGLVHRAPQAVGWTWVHLQDGTGDAAQGTHDLTVRTDAPVVVGQRVAFRGTLRADVDLGFGYHYDALLVDAEPVR